MSDPYARLAEQGVIEADEFGTGLHGYSDGNPVVYEDGSIITMRTVNALVGEVGSVIIETGQTPDEFDYTQVWTGLNKIAGGLFGSAGLGDQVVNAPLSMSTDAEVNDLTITGTGLLKTSGYKLFVFGTLTIEAGGVLTNAGSGGADGSFGGAAGSGGPSGSLAGGADGGAGKTVAGDPGTASLFALGGAAGAGGAADGGAAGGAAGGATPPAATAGSYMTLSVAQTGELRGFGAQGFVGGGAGGGGGGGNGIQGGGGGGGGGGVIIVWANKLINDGTITADGGNGGIGQGVAGGGGGGGGGTIIIVTRRTSGAGTVTADGGTGGASELTGDPGAPGAAGTILLLTA